MVLINGAEVNGIIGAEVQSTSFLAADRFTIRAALSGSDASIWSDIPLLIDVQVALSGNWTSLITGYADELTMDPIRGSVHVSGRDLTSRLISSQADESFQNQTSSDVAMALAARSGLSAVVIPTLSLTGRYYQTDRTRATLAQHSRATTSWDLLCWLAKSEGYDVWVQGETLYFQPPIDSVPVALINPAACMSMELSRALDIAAGLTVSVKSWNSVAQNTVEGYATNAITSDAVTRTVVQPNLSTAEADLLAARVLADISSHERTVRYEVPGDLTTMPRTSMTLAGTATDFDGIYRVCEVERRISFRHGFTQIVEARSQPWRPS